MQRRYVMVLFLMAGVGGLRGVEAQAGEPPAYEVYAVRYAKMLDFPVDSLVAGAEPGRKLDIAMTFWVLKGPDGRTVLVDAGFYRPRLLKERKGIADYTRPDKALGRLGIKPEEVTDVVLTHMHWDHADGADLFPKAQVWIQKDEFAYYTRGAKPPGGKDRDVELTYVSALVKLNAAGARPPGRWRRQGDPPGSDRLYRGAAHVRVAVRGREDEGRAAW